ncbi:MAG: putative bifunctional diguanylate cyclase/phosphodiesterase [Alphaproteobacteria bacterium]
MQPIPQKRVQSRLTWINGLFILSGLAAFIGFHQIVNGATLHKHNFYHVKHIHQLSKRIETLDDGKPVPTDMFRDIVLNIRAQPLTCIAIIGPIEAFAMRLAGTGRAIELCRDDIRLANETLALIDAYGRGDLTVEGFRANLRTAADEFLEKSIAFEPLIDRSVDLVAATVMVLLVVKSLGIALVGVFLSNGIGRSYRLLEETKEALIISENRYNRAINGSSDGIWDWDLRTDHVFYSEQNFLLLGEDPNSHAEFFLWWEERVDPEHCKRVKSALQRHFETGADYDETYRIRHADGHWCWWRSRGQALRDPDGTPVRMMGTNSDVTALVKAQLAAEAARRAVHHEATHDALTGLPNRRHLSCVLEDYDRRPEPTPLAIAHLDLDRFKEINDTLGHEAGDQVLVHCAKILRAFVKDGEIAARIGGDEFVIVFPDAPDDPVLVDRLNALTARLREPIAHEGKECRIGASVGLATSSLDHGSPNELLQWSDLALYKAKDHRGGCVLFDAALKAEVEDKKQIAADLTTALLRGEFFAVYEPQFAAGTHDLIGVEALARWNHPSRGVLAPAHFLDVADDMGVTAEIDDAILQRALKDLDRLTDEDVVIPKVSLNVSARRLRDPKLLSRLPDMGDRPYSVTFELLETVFLDRIDPTTADNLLEIKRRGFGVEIDDFGTGHASVTSVMRVRPRQIKIDRSLVAPIVDSLDQRQIVKSIITIGHALKISVLAEGVETMAHAAILSDLGCDALQGHAFSRPVRPEALASLIADRHRTRVA